MIAAHRTHTASAGTARHRAPRRLSRAIVPASAAAAAVALLLGAGLALPLSPALAGPSTEAKQIGWVTSPAGGWSSLTQRSAW